MPQRSVCCETPPCVRFTWQVGCILCHITVICQAIAHPASPAGSLCVAHALHMRAPSPSFTPPAVRLSASAAPAARHARPCTYSRLRGSSVPYRLHQFSHSAAPRLCIADRRIGPPGHHDRTPPRRDRTPPHACTSAEAAHRWNGSPRPHGLGACNCATISAICHTRLTALW